MPITVAALHRYPIKSCGGEPLQAGELDARGIATDRGFAVVDRAGVALTQRNVATMALIVPRLAHGRLTLSAPGAADCVIDLAAPRQRRAVTVWEHHGEGEDCGDRVAAWLEAVLGQPARLVRMPDDAVRPVEPAVARPGDQTGWSDGFPLLLVNLASLAALDARLGQAVPVDRFRANLVISGAEAFAEDGWRRIRIGSVECALVKPCARCVMITIDQATATRGPEPLRTLASFRTRDGKVLFGQNLIHRDRGTLRVGDEITVLE